MTLWQPALLTELLDRPPCRMIAEASPGQATGLAWLETALFTAPAGNSPLS